jgi:hypothetical protein
MGVGINETPNKEIQIYPNPTLGIFTIIPNKYRDQTLEVNVIDLMGRSVLIRSCKGADKYFFDLSGSQQGCYFVKIKTNDCVVVDRLIFSR